MEGKNMGKMRMKKFIKHGMKGMDIYEYKIKEVGWQ